MSDAATDHAGQPSDRVVSTVYLLHFASRHPNGKRPQHYLGVAQDPARRWREHELGNPGKGGALPRSFAQLGVTFEVVMVIGFETPGEAFAFERKLKGRKQHSDFCARCCHA